MTLTPRRAFIIFVALVVFTVAQAAWWIVFMARLVDEKVDIARELGGSTAYIEAMHQQEIHRQIMIGSEGVVFLLIVLAGAFLIYRSLTRTVELRFRQQNFLMAVTHELKTPIASIRVYLDTLQSDRIAIERKAEIMPRLRADVARLEQLVERVLEAGRFERSGYRLNREVFNLADLVRQRVRAFEEVPSDGPVEVAATIPDRVMFNGDRAATGRAIDAILENALKYRDGDRLRVTVELAVEGGGVQIRIGDNGIGIDAPELRRIFERFYRVGNELTRRTSGTGLGLYLCREIVRAHGGDVTAASAGAGTGTVFTIQLKRASDEADTAR